MKKFIFFWITLIATVPITSLLWDSCEAGTFPLVYGGGCDGEAGYPLDSFFVTHWYNGTLDTLITKQDTATTAICSALTITGEGDHWIYFHQFFNGYTEWYVDPYYYNDGTGLIAGWPYNTVTLFVVDTSGSLELIPALDVYIETLDGSDFVRKNTGASGYVTFRVNATCTVLVSGHRTGYSITGMSAAPADSLDQLIVTGDQTDSLFGYNYVISVSAPADTNLCRVFGYIKGNDQVAIAYAKVTLVTPNTTRNICDSSYIMVSRIRDTRTDTDGYFTIDVLKSSCMPDSSESLYKISVKFEEFGSGEHEFYIPADSNTYRVTFFE